MKNVTASVDYLSSRLYDEKKELSIWGESILHSYERVARLSILPVVTWRRHRQCIVFGSRIFGKLSGKGRESSHVVLSARDLLRMPVIPSSFSYDIQAYSAVCQAVRMQNSDVLDKLMQRINSTLDAVQPRLFVANSTIDPINRLWILAAREFGATVMCLQHGVYPQKIPDFAQEDDIVDSYIALDENQKKIVSRNIDPAKIIVLGRKKELLWKAPGNNVSVCFVGEDWERYGYIDLKQTIIARYREISRALSVNGAISLWYKPHPSEVQMFGIDKELKILSNKDMDIPDVFIGFGSSLLKDVSSKGKLAIQILESKTNADCFQLNGYCLSVAHDDNVVNNIVGILGSDQVSPYIQEQDLDSVLGLS